jgi:hypothetical protein
MLAEANPPSEAGRVVLSRCQFDGYYFFAVEGWLRARRALEPATENTDNDGKKGR